MYIPLRLPPVTEILVAFTKILGQMSIPPYHVGRFGTRRSIVILSKVNGDENGFDVP